MKKRDRKSKGAIKAESLGIHMLPEAVAIVVNATGMTAATVELFLVDNWNGEWHHAHRDHRRVRYYNTKTAIERLLKGVYSL